MKRLKGTAIASFVFGLTFWIPLLNLIFGIFAIYFGVKSLKNIKNDSNKYGGKWLAIIGLILGFLVYVFYLTGIGMCFAGNNAICKNIGLTALAK